MWKTVKLGDVCKINNGGTPKSKVSDYWGEGIHWLTPKDMGKLSGRYVSKTERQISQEGLANSSAKLIPQDSVILSCRAPIGHVAINEAPMSFNQGCKGLVPSPAILVEYLYYFLIFSRQLLNDLGTGTTFKEISGKTLANVDVPLPPLSEQQRIVAKLDAAFAEINRAIDVAESKYTEVEKLKAALLASALNGEDWKKLKLGDVCKIVNGSTPLRKESKFWADGDVPWFTIDDMRLQGRDIFSTAQHVTQAAVEEKKVKLIPENSVLLCCTASIGEAAIARKEMATNQQFNALTPLRDELSCEYLYYITTTLKKQLMRVSGSTTISFVSMGKLREIEIPLPPLSEQQRIVAKLDAAFAEIDKSAESISEARASYLALKSAILAQELQPPESKAA